MGVPPKPPPPPAPPEPPPIRFENEQEDLHLEYIILFLLLASFMACFSEVLS